MSEINELKDYLLKNPWSEDFYGRMEINRLYNYTISMTPEQLWPLISDASRVNKISGHQKVSFIEKNGKFLGKGKLALFYHKWEEKPWEWEYAREIKTSRIYSKGIVSFIRTHCILSRIDDKSTRLTIYRGIIPLNLSCYLILKISQLTFEKKIKNMINDFESQEGRNLIHQNSDGLEKYAISNSSDIYKIHEKKLNPIRDYLLEHKIEITVIYKLLNYVIHSSHDNLYRIKPKVLSEIIDVELDKLIPAMLHSCTSGLMNISWDIICPHCKVVKEQHSHLLTIRNKAICKICNFDFLTGGIGIIETTFSANPGLKKIDEFLLYSPEPLEKPHILLQKTLHRGTNFVFIIPKIEKQLRFRNNSKKSYGMLDVDQKAPLKNLYWEDLYSSPTIKCSPETTIFIKNTEINSEQYFVEIAEDDQTALRPSDLFNLSTFREVFPDEMLADGISIDIGIQNILLVDIFETTEPGSIKVLKTIKKYLPKVNDIVKKYDGVVIKNIGNTIMLSFTNPIDALRCSLNLITVFVFSEKKIRFSTRITINRGSCLAVNNDTLIDYSGQSISVLSKLHGFTQPGEICLTEDFINEKAVSNYLLNKKFTIKNLSTADIKNIGKIQFKKIRIKKLPV